MRVRRLIYKWGFRPRPGSIFYSPSLSIQAELQELWPQLIRAFLKGYISGRQRQ